MASIPRGPKAKKLRSVARLSEMMVSEEVGWGMRTRMGMRIRKREMMLRIEDNMSVCEWLMGDGERSAHGL